MHLYPPETQQLMQVFNQLCLEGCYLGFKHLQPYQPAAAQPAENRPGSVAGFMANYPLVNVDSLLWNITIFNGKIHYFNGNYGKYHHFYWVSSLFRLGHFQWLSQITRRYPKKVTWNPHWDWFRRSPFFYRKTPTRKNMGSSTVSDPLNPTSWDYCWKR